MSPMYPTVIWLGEQKWQIRLKSVQVDYALISKAHALRVSYNCRLWFGGPTAPSLHGQVFRPVCSYNAVRVRLLKVQSTPLFSHVCLFPL